TFLQKGSPPRLRRKEDLSMVKGLVFFFLLVLVSTASAAEGDPERGKEIYKIRACSICHSIERSGGAVGPDLTQVTIRRTDERLINWLRDPASLLPGTDMPRVPWRSDQEILDLIAYFKTFAHEPDRSFLGTVPASEAGRRLVEEYDCASCHRIVEPESGRDRFPELTLVGQRRTREWLESWLKDPQAIKPGTFMPTYPLSDSERGAIVEYLTTLK
ncbi:MAG TPA: c-type cytochrome, partial [Thermodesulfobacteriota bacterium]|nr:c-type cytochrome [Thermodesulfobacteriota bacterium]